MAKARSRPKAKSSKKPATKTKTTAKTKLAAKWKPATKKKTKPVRSKSAQKAKPAAKKPPAKKPPAKKPAPAKAPTKTKAPKGSLSWNTRQELAAAWNVAGRAHYTKYSEQLVRMYTGEDIEINAADTRTTVDGDAVVNEVIAMNAAGEGERVRELFDPAYGPVFEWIKSNQGSLTFVTLMGTDDVLVVHGSPWKSDNVAWHLRGSSASKVPGVIGFNRSRNREHLVVARETGLSFYNARDGVEALYRAPGATLPWPDFFKGERVAVESLEISDDGQRVVMTAYRQGILLASRKPGDPPWQLVHPSPTKEFGASTSPGDMTHAAISRDGTRIAFGSQDTPHYTATVDAAGTVTWYATVGNLSEYPHYAVFSDDGRYTAFNSCHFYNGATVCFDWEGNAKKTLDEYEVHDEAPQIEDGLRVYAARWLPGTVATALTAGTSKESGAFALAGSGVIRFVNTKGELLAVQGFGSSAGSMDYDPDTNRFALTSYSGFVHIYDPLAEEEPGRIDGVRPRKEITRWALWPRLPNGPVRW